MSVSSSISERLSPAARVTRAIQAALERGVRPWSKPWSDAHENSAFALPRRSNGARYRGINVVSLWAAATESGFASPYWFTFKQTQAMGGQVRKGERGSFVVFYKELIARDDAQPEADELPTRRLLRGYVVFNGDQIDGLSTAFECAAAPRLANDGDDPHAAHFAKVPATFRFGGAKAFYAPSTDHVQLPPKSAFNDPTQFYATMAHEFGHWTRHPSRLDRDFGQRRFGDFGYALEELVAELCAAFVGRVIGVPVDHIEDHAGYISHWLQVVNSDPGVFLTAAGKAQAAADYLLGLMGCAGELAVEVHDP